LITLVGWAITSFSVPYQSSLFGGFSAGITEDYPTIPRYQLIISHPLHVYDI
jgi:hypothetical protein